MGWFSKKKSVKYKRELKKFRKQKLKQAYCPKCHEWYNPNRARQFRKHDHLG